MINNCANSNCNKPLHYLRDGRIFVFDVLSAEIGPDGKRTRHMQHYWLCGDCEPKLVVEYKQGEGVSVHAKRVQERHLLFDPSAMAS